MGTYLINYRIEHSNFIQEKDVDIFIMQSFDYVITVCDNAKETCPVFTGKVKNIVHIGFEDPAEVTGTEEEIWKAFRKIRDEIYIKLDEYFKV